MKLISSNTFLEKTLLRLIDKYSNISFAVAWATTKNKVFDKLLKNTNKIKRSVIGTHFYQTHPDVLKSFKNSDKVHFMLQPSGVFHPKIYYFWDDNGWELLIGSANLTKGALNINAEAMLLISDNDLSNDNISPVIKKLLDSYWANSKKVNKSGAEAYRLLWKEKQASINRVSGIYGKGSPLNSGVPINSRVMTMSWNKYYSAIRGQPSANLKQRCKLLIDAHDLFKKNKHFNQMTMDQRKAIAGLPNNYYVHSGWFGSMRGDGYFHQAVNKNNIHISRALDKIPLYGFVSKKHYQEFLIEFPKAFSDGKNRVGIASRLLALKRPDYFVCIDSRNRLELCKDFKIVQSNMTFDRYWDEIVERIIDSVWWNEPRPNGIDAGTVWDGRAAMLDTIFYKE